MAKFEVQIERASIQTGLLVVEAESEEAARNAALALAPYDGLPLTHRGLDLSAGDVREVDPALPAFQPLATFVRQDAAVERFAEEACAGTAPWSMAFDGSRLVLCSPDRDEFWSVGATTGGDYALTSFSDPMALVDPDATVDLLATCETPREAFEAFLRAAGLDLTCASEAVESNRNPSP